MISENCFLEAKTEKILNKIMRIEELKNCTGCYACVNICPKAAVTMHNSSEGFWYPVVDAESCVDCHICEEKCPVLSPKPNERLYKQQAYAVINKEDHIREKSSSGGVFTAVAEYILVQKGVVFGAAFSSDCKSVYHVAIENKDDLHHLRGAKYLQSKINVTFQQAKRYLHEGRMVLFSGTPCQIAGLNAYLGREYDNLYTQDMICHGIPSPLAWEMYALSREKKAISALSQVSFRSKKTGWKGYSVSCTFTNGSVYECNHGQDTFMRGFSANLFLRMSCHSCTFKGMKRCSDITLGDFWGIQHIQPNMDDDMGTSLVFVNSEKGQALLKAAATGLKCEPVDSDRAVCYNPSMIVSSPANQKRADFFRDVGKKDFVKVVNKYTRDNLLFRIKTVVKRIIHRSIKE